MNEGFADFFRGKRLTITVGDSTETMVATKAVAIVSGFIRDVCTDAYDFERVFVDEAEIAHSYEMIRKEWKKFSDIYDGTTDKPTFVDMNSVIIALRRMKGLAENIFIPAAIQNDNPELQNHFLRVVQVCDALHTLIKEHPIYTANNQIIGRG